MMIACIINQHVFDFAGNHTIPGESWSLYWYLRRVLYQ